MCFCCCVSRKSIIIYAIVISVIAFIYGIVAIAEFGSSTDIYKALIEKLKEIEEEDKYSTSKTSSTTKNNNYYDDYVEDFVDNFNNYYNSNSNSKSNSNNNYKGYNSKNDYDNDYNYLYANPYNSKVVKSILDSASYAKIQLLGNSVNPNDYNLIKSLKGIENGMGVILFIFPVIFLIMEIVFMSTICGKKEFQVLSDSSFQTFTVIRTVCLYISIVFIFLSLLYSILLTATLSQYVNLLGIIDSCSIGIIVGMVYGFYGFCYYITLARSICIEKALFLKVGSESNPGPDAQFRSNGEPISNNQGNNYNPNQQLQNPQTFQVYNINEPYIYNRNQQLRNPSTDQRYNNNESNFQSRNQQLRNPSTDQRYNNNVSNFQSRNQQLRNPSTVEIYNSNEFKTDEKFLYSHGTGPEEYITVKGVLYKRVDKPNNNINNNNYNQEGSRGRIGRFNNRTNNNNNLMRDQRRFIRTRNPNDFDQRSQNSKTGII